MFQGLTLRLGIALVALSTLASADGRAAPARQAVQSADKNAASNYRQAFAATPKNAPTYEQLQAAMEQPASPQSAAMLKPFARSLELLAAGSSKPQCVWDAPDETTAAKDRSFLNAARQLAGSGWLQMRVDVENKRFAPALQIAATLMRFSRHLQSDRLLVTHLVGTGVAAGTMEQAALALSQAPPASVQVFSDIIEKLPPRITVGEAAEGEIHSEVAHFRSLEKSTGTELTQAGAPLALLAGASPDPAVLAELLAVWDDPAKRNAGLKDAADLAAVGKAALDASSPRFGMLRKDWTDRVAASNALTQRLANLSLESLRSIQTLSDVQLAMLKAGIAIRLKGEAALAEHPDPTTQKPFTYRKVAGGFELESTFQMRDQPTKISFAAPQDDAGL